MKNLNDGLFNLQPKDVNSCDLDCIKKQWHGEEALLKRLTWTCNPKEDNLVYHACGNVNGLHMSTGGNGHCEWDWEETNALEVQMLTNTDESEWTPPPTKAPTPFPAGKWHTILHCEGDGKTENRVKDENFQELAKKATRVRICSTLGGGEDCVMSMPGNP